MPACARGFKRLAGAIPAQSSFIQNLERSQRKIEFFQFVPRG
jgi:hypothetical protein